MAATISTLLLIPEAAEAVKQLILLAWAAGEGVIDIRSLLSGNKVPLVKTSDNWQLTLASLFTLGIGDDGISGADAEEGITYKEYLRAFFVFTTGRGDNNAYDRSYRRKYAVRTKL